MMKTKTWICIGIFTFLLSYLPINLLAEAELPEKYVGSWIVDFDRTMESMKKSPKYNETKKEQIGKSILKAIKSMNIVISEEKFHYNIGKNKMESDLKVLSGDEGSATIQVTLWKKERTFKLYVKEENGEKFFQMKENNDWNQGNYYVFRSGELTDAQKNFDFHQAAFQELLKKAAEEKKTD